MREKLRIRSTLKARCLMLVGPNSFIAKQMINYVMFKIYH